MIVRQKCAYGALDGGLEVPHSDNKQLDAEVQCKYIYGDHVAAYMKGCMISVGSSDPSVLGNFLLCGTFFDGYSSHCSCFIVECLFWFVLLSGQCQRWDWNP